MSPGQLAFYYSTSTTLSPLLFHPFSFCERWIYMNSGDQNQDIRMTLNEWMQDFINQKSSKYN